MRATMFAAPPLRAMLAVLLVLAGLGDLSTVRPVQAQTLFNLKVNFANKPNPDTVPIPTGYVRDYGLPYGLRAAAETGLPTVPGPANLTYGWVNPADGQPLNLAINGTPPGNGRDRGFSAPNAANLDQRLDTLLHMQADDINGTFSPGVKTEGWWEVAVPNGAYDVTVSAGDAATITTTGPNAVAERHTINVEGMRAIDNFTLNPGNTPPAGSPLRFAQGTVRVIVNDGKLTVDAIGGRNTKINYIDIAQVATTPQQMTLQINSGGPELATSMGQFSADQLFVATGSRTLPTPVTEEILGTTDDELYRKARTSTADLGTVSYDIPVPGADIYRVRLHFVEGYFTGAPGRGAAGANRRKFDVSLEAMIRDKGLDLNAVAAPLTAVVREYQVVVTDNILDLDITATINRPVISAIQVFAGNQNPLVNAGPDQTRTLGDTTIQLAGSAFDYNNDALTYSWLQTAGPNVTLSSTSAISPTFQPVARGTHTFQLTVNDGKGGSASDTVNVIVVNRVPLANAGSDQSVQVGQPVQLSATTSSDPDGDPLTYNWTKINGPTASLTGANTATPSFTPATKGTYTFQVTVNDGQGGTNTDTVVISVANRAPTASALASPTETDVGTNVQLRATANDLDGDPLTYSWQQTGGPQTLTIADANAAIATIVPTAKGVYSFTVTVADNEGGSTTAVANLTVRNRAPVAAAGTDRQIDVEQSIQLNGNASSDLDGDAITYAWSQIDGPTVTLSGADTPNPTFTAPGTPAVLIFQLIVTDSEGASSTADTIQVTVNEIPISGLNASSDSPTVLGQITNLSAAITGGSNVSYSWNFGDGNTGNGASTNHTYAAAGIYTATVTASNTVGQVQAEVIVSITNAQPLAQAGNNQDVNVNTLVNLTGTTSSDPDGHLPLTYGWLQTEGTAVTLTDANSATPSFTAPAAPTVLVFSLVVTDSFGLASEPDTVIITVLDTAPGAATLTSNGPTILGTPTTLTATSGGSNLRFVWEFGDATAAVTTTTTSPATITHIYPAEGIYIAKVTITNSTNQVRTALRAVEVTNRAPTVVASDVDGVPGTSVTLNATESNDPDGHTPLSYRWEQIGGEPVELSATNTATVNFQAPPLPNSYTFRVTVTDPYGKSSNKVVRARVQDQRIEGLRIALDREVTPLGETTTMTALLDLGTNVSYQWEFGDGTTASGRVVSHTYALEGNYPVKVTAVNSRNTLVASLLVGVLNTAPNVDAGTDQIVLLGSEVSLTANANDPDDHEPLNYLWEQISGPTVNIIGAGTATASFIAPAEPATLIFQLTVSDAFGKSSTDTIIVEAKEFAAFQTNKIFIPMVFRP